MMTDLPLQLDELSPLVSALCDDTIDDEGIARLQRLIVSDQTACRWYIAYVCMHVGLSWDLRRGDQPTMGGASCKAVRCEGSERAEGPRSADRP
jgi:hypothetical protein